MVNGYSITIFLLSSIVSELQLMRQDVNEVLRNQVFIMNKLDEVIKICAPHLNIQTPASHTTQTEGYFAQETLQEAPHPITLEGVNGDNILTSSEIEKASLKSVDETENLPNLPTVMPSNAGKIAVLLAREALFGVDIMARCTPLGAGKLPGLPAEELKRLKQIILQYFPQYWQNIPQFEKLWKKCQTALEHCCSSLRRKAQS